MAYCFRSGTIYFTRTDHNVTGIGNTPGYAAIENAADYGALMILGRAGTPKGRYVRLWDYLQVNGGMDITGNVGIGWDAPPNKLTISTNTSLDGMFLVNHPGWVKVMPCTLGTGSYNALSSAGDSGLIFSAGSVNTGGLVIGPWSTGAMGIKIAGNGNVGIGTATPTSKLDVAGTVTAGTVSASAVSTGAVSAGAINASTISAGTVTASDIILPNGIWKSDGRVAIGTATSDFIAPPGGLGVPWPVALHVAGNVRVDGRVLESGSSDFRLKESIEPIDDALKKIGQINGVSFYWIEKSRGVGRELGVIAQEVEEVFPEMVYTDGKGYKSVAYNKLVAPLIEAVKELKAELNLLQNQNDQLSAENQTLRETNQRFEARLSRLEQLVPGN